MTRKGNILFVGPLSEVDERLSELSLNLMTSFMMLESMERLEEAEVEFNLAQSSQDPDEVKEKELHLRACENTVQIAVSLLGIEEETYQ